MTGGSAGFVPLPFLQRLARAARLAAGTLENGGQQIGDPPTEERRCGDREELRERLQAQQKDQDEGDDDAHYDGTDDQSFARHGRY